MSNQEYVSSLRPVVERAGMYGIYDLKEFITFVMGVNYGAQGNLFRRGFHGWMKTRYHVPSGLHWASEVCSHLRNGQEGMKQLFKDMEECIREGASCGR